MQLTLPPALDAFVKDLVAQGRYADEADVVRDALRRLAEHDLDPETGLSISVLRARACGGGGWATLRRHRYGSV